MIRITKYYIQSIVFEYLTQTFLLKYFTIIQVNIHRHFSHAVVLIKPLYLSIIDQ